MLRVAKHAALLTAGLLIAGGALAACGSSSGSAQDSEALPAVTVTDAWIRASDGPMTGIFGDIANTSGADVTIVSATNSASAMTEIHEMAMVDGKMVMQEKAGGVVLPAASTTYLEPGGDHIMAMGMTAPVAPGDEVEVTLTLSTGDTVTFTAVAKDSAAGDEEYHESDHSDMEMDSDMDGDM
jgi:periplasmic copper chaperone A